MSTYRLLLLSENLTETFVNEEYSKLGDFDTTNSGKQWISYDCQR